MNRYPNTYDKILKKLVEEYKNAYINNRLKVSNWEDSYYKVYESYGITKNFVSVYTITQKIY